MKIKTNFNYVWGGALALGLLVQTAAYSAKWGMAGCGLGSLVFEDKPGKIQILAATTNNAISPQSYAITTGTSNCEDHSSRDEALLFININQQALRKDASRGEGETIAHLSAFYRCSDLGVFGASMQKNYETIFPQVNTPAIEVNRAIESTIRNDKALAASCKALG